MLYLRSASGFFSCLKEIKGGVESLLQESEGRGRECLPFVVVIVLNKSSWLPSYPSV